jgi:glucosamine--fructose-6-phosphate aminotransferase (isomerizing)
MTDAAGTPTASSPRRSSAEQRSSGEQPSSAETPGRLMAAEIAAQPDSWRNLLHAGGPRIAAAAAAIRARSPRFVLLLARGTSDRAALYAKYLIEIKHQLPAGLVSPSTMTAYGARPDLRDVMMIAVSQSGGSPDLVTTLQIARAQGALTVAVTNSPHSALAEAADLSIDVMAGEEAAVAATKSYSNQLLALYLLLERARGSDGAAALALPALGSALLRLEERMAVAAERYRFAQRMVVTGRGYSYPTAQEAALKLMETSYLSAHAFSGADLLHGPLALLDSSVPVVAIMSAGIGGQAMQQVVPRLRETGADVFCVGSAAAVAGFGSGVVLPDGVPDELTPLLEIVPLQHLALHLAIQRGSDPDTPRGLKKVTKTL